MTIVVETQQHNDRKSFYTLKKVLPSGIVFPFDLGFIPGTEKNGEPLCVLLLSEFANFQGCTLECRVIGGIEAFETVGYDKKVRNDKLIAVCDCSKIFSAYQSIADLPADLLSEIEDFFIHNKEMKGKEITLQGTIGAYSALKQVAIARFHADSE